MQQYAQSDGGGKVPVKPVPGPAPRTLSIEGKWEGAVSKALRKPRPASGWPKPAARKGPPKKRAKKP